MTTMLEKAARAMFAADSEINGMAREWALEVHIHETYRALARAALQAIREPGIDAGLIGAKEVNQQMRGPVKADYCAAQDSFTAIIDAILGEKA